MLQRDGAVLAAVPSLWPRLQAEPARNPSLISFTAVRTRWPQSRELVRHWHHSVALTALGFVTTLAPGSRSPSKHPGPPATRGKHKTQECYPSWLSQLSANFQRIYSILKFSPSAQYFSKTKHLHQFSGGRGYGCGAAPRGSKGTYFSWQTLSAGKGSAPALAWLRRRRREVSCLL